MVTKWCGSCGHVNKYDDAASFCINCGKRTLDYRCLCGRLHFGGMPCHCEKIPTRMKVVDQYQTTKLYKGIK